MSVTRLFTNYAVELDTKTAQSGTSVFVDGVQDMFINSQLQTRLEGGDGSIYNTFGSLVSGAPTAQFTTNDIKAFLDACGVTGMLIDSDVGTGTGVHLYAQEYALGGTRVAAATATHLKWTIANGILVPRTLEMTHQGKATITGEIVAVKSSTVAPIVVAASILPASVYPQVSAAWSIGKAALNATTIDAIQSISIDFGIDLLVDSKDGDVYPTFVSVRRIQPVITIVTATASAAISAAITIDGYYYATDTVVFYARKLAEGGTVTADVTAEHIKFTLGKCRVDWATVKGDPKLVTLRLTPWYTAGASPKAPLAINTASAIT
jgi:hypothetical protein